MSDVQRRAGLMESYLQADAAAREPLFKDFMSGLRSLSSEDGPGAAHEAARRAVSPSLNYSSLMALRRYLPGSGTECGPGPALRLAVLGGPTTTQLRQLVEIFLAGEGIAAQIYEGDYGLFRQELLVTGSGLDAFGPQVVFVATGVRDVVRLPSPDMDEAAVDRLVAEEAEDWARLWEAANARWDCAVLMNNFESGPDRVFGHYAVRHPASHENYVERLNRALVGRAPGYVVMHDLRGLAAEFGAREWFDPRFYLEFKMPCGPECLVGYAYSVVSLLRAVRGRSKKVIALDLDNTLWGGVVGDLGAGGIRLGEGSGEGEAYLAFQRYARDLKSRGILLAVCSKNDDDKAREPFEVRPDMALKLSDIACFTANWENKVDNLREIARRLDLGLDSFVFVDDNPAERALVRQYLPQVAVPDMPEDPAGYVRALASRRYFETTSFTQEDSSRSRYYAENVRRHELAAGSSDINAFLASLGMRMRCDTVNDLTIERVTQLVNKSNQFNLTTRRYSLAQLREMAASPDWWTLTLSLSDRLGDNGLISVILLRRSTDALAVDTWVMSCRVLQRGVEFFARNKLVEAARVSGCPRVLGVYIPSAKNTMVKDHYSRLGFAPAGVDGDQALWSLAVDDALAPLAHHIQEEPTHV